MSFRKSDRGVALAIVMFIIIILGMFIFFIHQRATQDRHSLYKIKNQYITKLAAESILAISSSSIVESKKNNDFQNRWYKVNSVRTKNEIKEKQGYLGKIEGQINILAGVRDDPIKYTVIAEDIPGPVEKKLSSKPNAKELHQYASAIKYYRTDLFARVEYGGDNLVLYSPLVVHPEEKIYNINTKTYPDPKDPTVTIYETTVDQDNLR